MSFQQGFYRPFALRRRNSRPALLELSKKNGRLLDSYKGVPVYENGLLFFRSQGKNYSANVALLKTFNTRPTRLTAENRPSRVSGL